MKGKILITGASGLLGKALVEVFCREGIYVLGQYHRHRPAERKNCDWIYADFSDSKGIGDFLELNKLNCKDCLYLVNNYGPITYKDISGLESEDLAYDFFHNVITAFEITTFFLKHTGVASIVNLGFEGAGEPRAFQNIVAYAASKNALLLLTKSFAKRYTDVRFNMVSPAALEGASVGRKKGRTILPQEAARKIFEVVTGTQSGRHFVV